MNFNAAGAIVSVQDGTMPVAGGDIIVLSDDVIPDNNIVAGYGELYLLAERAGSEFARSDEYRFAEDQVAFKGTARYDGQPVIAEGFIAIGPGRCAADLHGLCGRHGQRRHPGGVRPWLRTYPHLCPRTSTSIHSPPHPRR